MRLTSALYGRRQQLENPCGLVHALVTRNGTFFSRRLINPAMMMTTPPTWILTLTLTTYHSNSSPSPGFRGHQHIEELRYEHIQLFCDVLDIFSQLTIMITELDKILIKKNNADALDAPNQNRTHKRRVGLPKNISLPKIRKPNTKIPRSAIDRQWLIDNPDWDVPSRMEGGEVDDEEGSDGENAIGGSNEDSD
jgi:hypothetical protein